MFDPKSERLEVGGLWRDVVNHLGDGQIQPALYLPLLRAVLPRWADWTYFLARASEKLTKDRAELEADAARAELGWCYGRSGATDCGGSPSRSRSGRSLTVNSTPGGSATNADSIGGRAS